MTIVENPHGSGNFQEKEKDKQKNKESRNVSELLVAKNP